MSLSTDELQLLTKMGEALSGEREMLTSTEWDMFDSYYMNPGFRKAYHDDEKIQRAWAAINKLGAEFGAKCPDPKYEGH